MVQSGAKPIMNVARECWRLFDNDVGVVQLPASAVIPTLEELITQVFQEPTEARYGFVEAGDPQLDVMDVTTLHWFDCTRGSQVHTETQFVRQSQIKGMPPADRKSRSTSYSPNQCTQVDLFMIYLNSTRRGRSSKEVLVALV